MHHRWPDIESFYALRKTFKKAPELLQGTPVVQYRAKVKLHGSCAGIHLRPDGEVGAFSRETVLTPGKGDNAGFAAWVMSAGWGSRCHWDRDLVIFGEWCGPGIQKGVAVNQLPERIFAVFAIQNLAQGHEDELIVEPAAIAAIVGDMPRTYVLPWYHSETEVDQAVEAWHTEDGQILPDGDVELPKYLKMTRAEYAAWALYGTHPGHLYEIDWSKSAEELEPVIARINTQVKEVEVCDPWIQKTFGVQGVGEGLVFYPVSHPGLATHTHLCFKAKGEKHAVVAHTKPVQADPTVAADLQAFAEMVVTPARLEQALRAVAGGELDFDMKHMGPFLKWISADVTKETKAEMEAAGLRPKDALAACTDRAKAWLRCGQG